MAESDVARMQRSGIREAFTPQIPDSDPAGLHPGYMTDYLVNGGF